MTDALKLMQIKVALESVRKYIEPGGCVPIDQSTIIDMMAALSVINDAFPFIVDAKAGEIWMKNNLRDALLDLDYIAECAPYAKGTVLGNRFDRVRAALTVQVRTADNYG